jgi:hypothetical protein
LYFAAFLDAFDGSAGFAANEPLWQETVSGNPASSGFDDNVHDIALVTVADTETEPPRAPMRPGEAVELVMVGDGGLGLVDAPAIPASEAAKTTNANESATNPAAMPTAAQRVNGHGLSAIEPFPKSRGGRDTAIVIPPPLPALGQS